MMKKPSNISLSFALIILLLTIQGIFSLSYLSTISTQVEKLYQHPYVVSNAARDIRIDLISMHRYMKDVALAESEGKIELASALVDKHEQRVLTHFDSIFERYLGDSADIQQAYKAFINWKVIRDEVIRLKTKGRNKEAADITRNKGANHVFLLNQEAQKLVDFADQKAESFLRHSLEVKSNAYLVITALLLMTVLVSIVSAYYTVTRLRSAQSDMKERMHLIDQNILMCKLDNQGIVSDVSNHLCRFLGESKLDCVGRHLTDFTGDEESAFNLLKAITLASTGKAWEGEVFRLVAGNSPQWVYLSIYPELNEDHMVRGYSLIINDITDQKLSITDALTGLNNRRYFDEVFPREIRLAARNKATLTFVMIDIDYFKKYNDLYGHMGGDEALMKVASVLQSSLMRPNDYVFRLGGEEFGIVVSEANQECLLGFLNRVRQAVEDLAIEHADSDVSRFVTVSIGAHSFHGHVGSIEGHELYAEADHALYEAKKTRNRVLIN